MKGFRYMPWRLEVLGAQYALSHQISPPLHFAFSRINTCYAKENFSQIIAFGGDGGIIA